MQCRAAAVEASAARQRLYECLYGRALGVGWIYGYLHIGASGLSDRVTPAKLGKLDEEGFP